MRIAVVDVETTGFDPVEDRIVEFAQVVLASEPWAVSQAQAWLCDPERDIPPGAKAVHHITEAMVAGLKPAREIVPSIIADADCYAAHNAAFDFGFLKGMVPDRPIICTWRVAAHMWKEAPGHSNQVLRYWLGVEPAASLVGEPHRALYDALVTAGILRRMILDFGVDELIRLSDPAVPVIQRAVSFGKSRGKLWAEMDRGFLRWVLNNDFDDDTKATARFYLEKARASQGLQPQS